MKRRFLSVTILAITFLAIYVYASADTSKEQKRQQQMEQILKNLPDSVFEDVKIEDLLNDEVYLKLAHDGWSPREISAIMESAVKDKNKARQKSGYGFYAKQWRPTYGRALGDDPLYQFVDSGLSVAAVASINETVGENDYNASWEKVIYNPAERKQSGYIRNPGYFRAVELNPSSGRIHWIVVNQNDPKGDMLYVIADGTGIFRTDNCGKSWTCITDKIPDRTNRSQSTGYAIPVDPDDWDHVFAFMLNNSVYETKDGGKTWRRIENATHKSFKRGYCFRSMPENGEKEGKLKFIGAEMNGSDRMKNVLWISEDTCKTWVKVTPKAEFLHENSNTHTNGFWFQQMAFDPIDRNRIYLPGCNSILYFDDGAKKDAGGNYNLKCMQFNVYGADKTTLRAENVSRFPFDGNGAGHMELDPDNPNRMWYATGRVGENYTALYYSDDRGANWITLHEPHVWDDNTKAFSTTGGFGSGTIFGNEIAHTWLGGFGVEFTTGNVFGCSMSSAYSFDGGRNFTEYAWGVRQRSWIENGTDTPGYYYVSASRHNADNHCIASHRSGRLFRGSDGGLFMHDPNISGVETNIAKQDWVNIASNMGEMLFYNIRVNEFGDQAIIGNTQDIDIQTYRYGRWGHWRGYEGSEASFNPYTSTGYFSGGGGDGPEGMNPSSWHTATNYADVVTNSWYMLRTWSGNTSQSTLFRVDDIGRSLTDLYDAIGKRVTDVALSRDKKRVTVFVRTADNALAMSTDTCKTFVPIMSNGKQAAFSNSHIASDPDDSSIIYVGQNGGKVWKFEVETGKFTAVGTGLPNISCSRIIFHEGSGDLYFVCFDSGIYILKNGDSQWKFWTRGYNPGKFRDCSINYTTQEMVIADYGRGVWVADLETPKDRYFPKGFKLKEYSNRNGRRTFGIDTKWTIPLYYNYEWYVNGKKIDNPYQYLNIADSDTLETLQLKLTLRESPDVSTLSDVYTVSKSESQPIERHQGNALYSNGMGRVDIGYMDWFYKDFTVDLWVKPSGDGVIMANTQKSVEKGAKGWVLYIEGGLLKFKYYPSNVLQQPTYETTLNQNPVVTGSAITMNKWSHVAVTEERTGSIVLYINGEPVGTAQRIRGEEHSLNNSVVMSLFGDSFEQNTLQGSVDELKVWNKALSIDDVRREMFSTNIANDGSLVAHYDFNGNDLESNRETFTAYKPISRTRAVTSAQRMTVPVSADYVDDKELSGSTNFVFDNTIPLMTIDAGSLSGVKAVVYGYDAGRWDNPDDNLSEEYYNPTDYGYMIRTFGAVAPETVADITFHNGAGSFDSQKRYRLYTADNSEDRLYWKQFKGDIVKNADGTLKLTGVKLNELTDRKLLIISMKPAIEMTVEGLSSDGRIVLYDDNDDATAFPFTARLIEGKTISNNSYEIMSDSAVLIVPEKPLSFDSNHEAHGNILVDMDLIGDFNNTISTYIRGKNDSDMIPIPVDILNRISPKTLNNSAEIINGGLKFGTAADFAKIKGTQNFTIMGWVRIDNESVITSGRNGDGYAPLMFFRSATNGATATGINLYKGNLGYHWNDQSWNYTARSNFNITSSDIGKWVHLALVVQPDGAYVFFNGMKQKMSGTPATMPVCNAESPLLLGLNVQGGNTYFSGAFDHVAVWNRSLSDDEVHKYMQNRVLLNDPGLLAYITMDEFDETNKFKESTQGMTAVQYGTVKRGAATPVPFAPIRQSTSLSTGPITLGGTASGYTTTFEGAPYNYINAGTEYQEYLPLNHEFYTLIFNSLPTNSTGSITMVYNFEGLIDGEEIAVGIRQLGSTTPFANYVTATSVEGKKATFSIPAEYFNKSSELMFFSTPGSSHRPTIVNMRFSNSELENGGTYLLPAGIRDIDVTVDVVSGNDPVQISATESYVKVSTNDIDMNDAEQKVTLTIDKDELRKINPFGLSDVTLNLSGTTAEPLTLKVGLTPVVELRLKNGNDATHYVAKSAVSTLDIEAELKEGYLDKEVQLAITPDYIKSALNISNGSLLLNSKVSVKGLEYGLSPNGSLYEGWNLIGNPYLTDINVTKSQNVEYDPNKVTKFVYHTLNGSDNIAAFDMTDYDDEQKIKPFQSYFVQTIADDADITITEVAKEKTLNRKTFDYYTAQELRAVQLKLYSGDIEIDRTTVRWEDGASDDYQVNEDALKLRSISASENELYTLTADGVEASIDFRPDGEMRYIPLCIDVRRPGEMSLQVSRLTGFDGDKNKVYLVDFEASNNMVELSADSEPYIFTIDSEGVLDHRFAIAVSFDGGKLTDIGEPESESSYRVYTGVHTCTVTGLRGNAQINIYNASGALIVREHTDMQSFTAEIESGVYLVRIRENEKDYVTKIIVK